ncbi:TPA: ATP-binding cassette domain-containing protein [Candidatus Bathyarchaeota archaeon]|nr:ATP-binding cassette domain-containing protein [Candidatus Bathyarchaeota archaeon]
MENAIEVKGLTKSYASVLAVDRVSFQVRNGEFFGFLGPNGAGKTTTLRMLTGLIKPDSGTALIMGYDVQKDPLKVKQGIGVLPEVANAYTDLTAWQNLMFLGELYGLPKALRRERAAALLKKLGLYGVKDKLVKGFSKGMKQKLLVCMALLNDPKILFLDEPTSGLDVQSARLIRDMLREFNRSGVTIFLTTHNMDEANQLCDRVAIINHGRIVAVGRPEELKSVSNELRSVEVAFNKPVEIGSLAKLPPVLQAKKVGDKVRMYTKDPDELIYRLVEYAKANGLKFVALNVLSPTLEDIFIRLIEKDGGVARAVI